LYVKTCKILILQVLFLEKEETKMKMKKTVIVMLAAVLLISAALIVGCMSPQDGLSEKQDAEDNFQIPAGKKVIRLKVPEKNARTILPDFTDFEDGGNLIAEMYFDVKFELDNGLGTGLVTYYPGNSTSPSGDKLSYAEINGPHVLPASGSYFIEVTAFDDDDGTTAILRWTSGVTAYPTSGGAVNVYLTGITDGTGEDGLFNYNIAYTDFPGGTITSLIWGVRTLDILDYNTKSSVMATLAYDTNATIITGPLTLGTPGGNVGIDDIVIPSGYYIVRVSLAASNCLTTVVDNVMHIYPGMTSSYNTVAADIPSPGQNIFTVQLESNSGTTGLVDTNYDGSGGTLRTVGSIANATTISPPDPVPTNTNYEFDSWHTSNALNNAFDLSTRGIFTDRKLWAKYKATVGLTINITFNIEESTLTPSGDPTTFSYNDIKPLAAGSQIVLTLSGVDGDYNSISWILKSGVTEYTLGSTRTITLNGDHTNFAAWIATSPPNADYQLTVRYTKTETPGVPQDASTMLTLYNP
jgi:hypothetical protein